MLTTHYIGFLYYSNTSLSDILMFRNNNVLHTLMVENGNCRRKQCIGVVDG